MALVMIVEDNGDIRITMREMVVQLGHQAILCIHGGQAAKYMDGPSPLPALILTNWDMPEMNGEESLKRLANNARYKHIPVVVISGSPLAGLPNHIGKLTKPVRFCDITTLVELHTKPN